MNIPLTPPPPLGIPVVIIGTIVAVVEVDGAKVDCVTDKEKDIDVNFSLHDTFVMYMFPIIAMVEICHLNCIISIISMMSYQL